MSVDYSTCLTDLIGLRLLSRLDQCQDLNDCHKIRIGTSCRRFVAYLQSCQGRLDYDFCIGRLSLSFSLGLDSMNSSLYNSFIISLQFQTFQ